MRKFSALVLLALIVSVINGCARGPERVTEPDHHRPEPQPYNRAEDKAARPKKPVPAYQSKDSIQKLNPTLSPDLFQGETRAAYAAVRAIPKTIAQLPCFCRCDKSVGHKSLYSCFEDDHGANCGICMNSALKAYKLEKEQKMSVEEIRAELIREYDGY
ncbi:MAG: hypothetical protein IPM59_05260 [Chloracidobacterium sp.]|nr:hypothetical protein [Chloracidobacterium sp.]